MSFSDKFLLSARLKRCQTHEEARYNQRDHFLLHHTKRLPLVTSIGYKIKIIRYQHFGRNTKPCSIVR